MSQSRILLLALLGAAGVFAAILFLAGEDAEPPPREPIAFTPGPVSEAPVSAPVEISRPREVETGVRVLPTTVLWPLEVELDLVRASYLPRSPEGELPGTGRRARMAGNVADAAGEPVRAEIVFAAGANQGRVLLCDASGAFGANDLYPGLAVVEVRGPGIAGARREVVLRQGTEYLLNIGFGRPGAVQGDVIDPDGTGIPDALVTVDGHSVRTNPDGYFFIGGLASDRALLEIRARGFAGLREVVGVTADHTIERGTLVYRLERGASLDLVVTGEVGGRGPAQVVLLPADTRQQRRFPWYLVNPVDVTPGTAVRVDDLPAGPVTVRAFHRGAQAKPVERLITLRTGDPNRVDVELEPAPTLRGTVTLDGLPVANARVRLEAPDRVNATLSYFRTAHWFLESEILPPFPFAVQETLTDGEGVFQLTAWSDVVPSRYLEAWSPDGSAWAGQIVGPDDRQVSLALSREAVGQGALVLELPGRIQPLDVALSINGTPAEPFSVAADRPLRVDRLIAGVWRVRALWYDQVVFEDEALTIEGETTVRRELPEDAVVGQDREAWLRAGRAYPDVQ